MDKIIVRKAKKEDSENIFEWRNNLHTRRMSHNKEIIDWEKHHKWFLNALSSKKKFMIICENYELMIKIGIVQFDISNTVALVSINLNPAERGKGFSEICLNEAIQFFSKKFLFTKILCAEIREDNKASINTFLKVGFKKRRIFNGIGYYQKILNTIE